MRNIAFNDFSGGMVTDPRDTRINVCRICSGFDAFTYSNKLVPNPSSVVGDGDAAIHFIKNFCFNGGTLFGLGQSADGGLVQIYEQTNFDGGSDAWTTPSNSTSSSGALSALEALCFVPYHGYIYGLHGNNEVWSFKEDGSAMFADSVVGISHINAAAGLVHSKDDIMYIPTDNIINSYNSGTSTWLAGSSAALILPTSQIITCICEYGNYLAIATYNASNGTSKVYIWDRNSSLTTLSEEVDWGGGKLMVIHEMSGVLVGISIIDSTVGVPCTQGRLIFKTYNSGASIGSDNGIYPGATKFLELVSSTTGNILNQCKKLGNNRLYFMASFTIEGVLYEGVWAIGHSNTWDFSVVHDRKPNNDTQSTGPSDSGNGTMFNFISIGDCMIVAYETDGNYAMNMSDLNPHYNSTSVYQTVINPLQPERYRLTSGMRTEKKQVISTRLCTEVLTSGQNAVLDYRVDGGSWEPLINATADGFTVRENANTDLDGNAIVQGREYEFELASYGGAQITEFVYKLDENSTLFDAQ